MDEDSKHTVTRLKLETSTIGSMIQGLNDQRCAAGS